MDKVTVKIKLDTDSSGVTSATIDVNELDKAVESVVKSVNKAKGSFGDFAESAMAMAAVSELANSLNDQIQKLSSNYNDFNQAMRSVNTMAGKDEAEFKKLTDQVTELGKTTAKTRTELADGLYQVISNGVPEENWISFLEQSAKASVGGIADLGQVVGVTSTIIKNYGMDWAEAVNIQDKIQLTAKNGVTSFEQLAGALPRVSANAATLGVSVDEMLASFATLTGVSGNTAEVSTQLGAVFTALVKPSSEAAKMAEEMGIQFDAAAIKSAGGFENFLKMLDLSVKQYSASSGVLEQEVYGRLFGSAEALRALIPLQGELAEKFETNVQNMANSEGTIEEANKQMTSTGQAALKMLQNYIDSITDWAGAMASTIAPYTAMINNLGQTGMSLKTLKKGFFEAKKAMMAMNNPMTIVKGSFIGVIGVLKKLGMAIKAFCVSNPLLAVLTAVTTAAVALYAALSDDEEKMEELKEVQQAYVNATAEANAEIRKELESLKELIIAGGDEAEMVEHLNAVYGEAFGTYSTAEDWYDTLIRKSKEYCLQKGLEAKAQAISNKMAEKQAQLWEIEEKRKELEATGKHQKDHTYLAGGNGREQFHFETFKIDTSEYRDLKQQEKEMQQSVDDLNSEYLKLAKAIKETSESLKTVKAEGGQVSDAFDMQTASIEELTKKLNSNKKLQLTSPEEIERIKKENNALMTQIELRRKQLGYKTEKGVTTSKNKGADAPEGSLAAMDYKIREVQAKVELEVDPTKRSILYNELDKLKKEKIKIEAALELQVNNEKLKTLSASAGNKMPEITKDLKLRGVDKVKADLKSLQDAQMEAAKNQMTVQDNILSTADSFGVMGEAIGGAAGSMMQWAAQSVAAIMQVIPQIATLIAAKQAEGIAGATAAGASVMFPANIAAIAAGVATVIASFAKMPKFANGGIISGPTIGLMGEYSGASNNPEVVAPLNKLKSMLGDVGGGMDGRVQFEIKGRKLVGVLARENSIRSRS